jgi:DNA-binding response OmpR family regulator
LHRDEVAKARKRGSVARILVVDDGSGFRDQLRDYLRHDAQEVMFTPRSQALNEAFNASFDVIVVVVVDREPSECSFIRRIRSRHINAQVLLIASDQHEREIAAGLNCGADGYLIAPLSPAVLQAKVRSLLRRSRSAATRVLRVGSLTLNLSTREASLGGRSVRFSEREFDVLRALASQPNAPINKEHLLEVAWGHRQAVSLNVVEVYIGYVRRRLGKIGAETFVVTRRGHGYELRAVTASSEVSGSMLNGGSGCP